MNNAIAHRGPDGDGIWADEISGVALAQRRLAIVDLSETGAQPMHSSCGRWAMVYNGEVYNANEIAADFPPEIKLKGTSDTEVILEAIALWGIETTVKRLIGMFAIAAWNHENQELTLVRDRVGIKPLYWSKSGSSFLFGSELKALRQHPDCPRELDHTAIAGFLRKSYINAPRSIYSGVNHLPPGYFLTTAPRGEPRLTQYWSLHTVAQTGMQSIDQRGDREILDDMEELLADSIKRRMIADVPLGAFLSGGIDSSTVVALMQKHSSTPVRSFSIGFDEEGYNEAQHAAQVAAHLKTNHTELYVTSKDALDVIPQLHTMYDEPFADASQIPTYLVSKMTRKHVTVALSGDGGDELFAGYERYFTASKYQRLLDQPAILRKAEARTLELLSPQNLKRIGKFLPPTFAKALSSSNMTRVPNILRDGHTLSLYQPLLWHTENPSEALLNKAEPDNELWDATRKLKFTDRYAAMQFIDMLDYLPDDILAKVDRASMATSLEARVPILDHRMIEFAWTLPEHMKVRHGQGKWALRQILNKYVPANLIDRPKMGFGIPIDAWLRGPLRDWAEDLLSVNSLNHTGIFETEVIRKRWAQHLSNEINWQYHLWDVLIMQDWAKHNG